MMNDTDQRMRDIAHPWVETYNPIFTKLPAYSTALNRLQSSVLRTMFLPTWVDDLTGNPVGIGGLNPAALRSNEIYSFCQVNTDAMDVQKMLAPKAPKHSNLPGGHGSFVELEEVVRQIRRVVRHLFLPPRSDYVRAEVDIRIATDTAGPWSCGAGIRRRICVLDTAPRVG
jgi:Domain of unknown function (DUF4135)